MNVCEKLLTAREIYKSIVVVVEKWGNKLQEAFSGLYFLSKITLLSIVARINDRHRSLIIAIRLGRFNFSKISSSFLLYFLVFSHVFFRFFSLE